MINAYCGPLGIPTGLQLTVLGAHILRPSAMAGLLLHTATLMSL